MQSSTSQPIKTQPLTPNIRTILSPTKEPPLPDLPSTSTTTTNGTVPPPQPQPQPQYPDVSHFTFLPELYLMISRLAPLRQTLSEPSANGTTTVNTTIAPTASQPPDSSLSQTISRDSQLSGSGSSSSQRHIGSSADGSIEVKDLPAHVYGVKQSIARTREMVAGFPDVARSVEVQEREIAALKRRIAGLKGRLGELGALAVDG